MGTFKRPVGAAADVKELEYISALHQTELPELRTEGTVSSTDILLYLRSRYGVVIAFEDSVDIVRGLGGTYRHLRVEKKKTEGRETLSLPLQGIGGSFGELPTVDEEEGPERTKHRFETDRKKASKNDPRQDEEAQLIDSNTDLPHQRHKKMPEVTNESDGDNNEEYLDLAQLTSILLIPTLVRATDEAARLHICHVEGESVRENAEPTELESVSEALPESHNLSCWEKRRQKFEAARKAEREALRPRPAIIRDVLRIMLDDIKEDLPNEESNRERNGNNRNPRIHRHRRDDRLPPERRVVLDKQLIRHFLTCYGELDAAADDLLIEQMMQAAGGPGTVLDELAFARALTSDVSAWEVGVEDRITTVFFDVFGFESAEANEYSLTGALAAVTAEGVEAANDLVDVAGGTAQTAATAVCTTVADEHLGTAQQTDLSSSASAQRTQLRPNEASADVVGQGQVKVNENAEDVVLSGTGDAEVEANSPMSQRGTGLQIPLHIPTAPYIDYVIDSYRSLSFLMCLWVFYIFGVLTGMYLLRSLGLFKLKCDPSFGCELSKKLWTWISVALVLCIGGMIIIVPISFANDPNETSRMVYAFSTAMLLFFIVVPYVSLDRYEKGIPHAADGELTDLEKALSEDWVDFYAIVYLLYGTFLLYVQGINRLSAYIPREKMRKYPYLAWWFTPYNVLLTTAMKHAATHKVNILLENAHKLHRRPIRGKRTTAMQNFVLRGQGLEDCGGFRWTWKRLWSRELFVRDGVFLPSRLFVGQEGQWMMLFVVSLLIFIGTEEAAQAAQNARDNAIENTDPGWTRDQLLYYIPEPSAVRGSMFVGGIISIIIGLCLIFLYLPSTVSIILKLRSGVIPTLHDRKFKKFRSSADTTFNNLAGMVYALAGSVAFFFVLVAGFLFLFLWPVTRGFMTLLLAWFLGLMITIGLKTIYLMVGRGSVQAAFFRRAPRKANFRSLAMECWSLGLGGGVMMGRIVQFLLASAFWVGRIDAQFLDDDVNLLGYSFDVAPTNYRKDILVHEAHKHPYMERLGALYLMRFAHRTRFSSDAGTWWRLLFTLSLMPWLVRYRQSEEDLDGEENPLFSSAFVASTNVFGSSSKSQLLAGKLLGIVGNKVRGAADMFADEKPSDRDESQPETK